MLPRRIPMDFRSFFMQIPVHAFGREGVAVTRPAEAIHDKTWIVQNALDQPFVQINFEAL